MQAVLAAAMLPWSVQLSDVTAWPSTQPDRYLPAEKPQHTMGRGAVGGGEDIEPHQYRNRERVSQDAQ